MQDLTLKLGIFLSQLSFWWLLIGLFLIVARMPTPGMRMVDKKKFYETKRALDDKLSSSKSLSVIDRILLYSGRYFFIYHYYRNDLVFIFVVGGALIVKLGSILLREML